MYYQIVDLKTFSVFPEYFIGISGIYILIAIILISYNVYGLIVQKALSNCIGLTLLLSCYLLINDDISYLYGEYCAYPVLGFYKSTLVDSLSFLTKLTICFFSSIFFFIIADYLVEYKLTSFEYLIILFFAVLGLVLFCCSNDLLTAYLAIELVSLSSYILASFKKSSNYSVDAGIKYLITGAISSALFLLGCSFIYAYSGSIYLDDFWWMFSGEMWFSFKEDLSLGEIYMYNLTNGLSYEVLPKSTLIELGLAFILISLFIKIAVAPFHLWSLDVYEGSPTISTFFFTAITKLSFFVFLARLFFSITAYTEAAQFYGLTVGLLSVFVGSFGGLRQKKLKTLLAYSSVSHMGYSILALSSGTVFGLDMLFFYLIIYIISNMAIWSVVLAIRVNRQRYQNKLSKELGDLALLSKSNPALAICFTIIMFSIAGIPPLVGFFAKMGVFLSLMQSQFYFIAVASVLCSVVSTFYYIRVIKVIYFENLLVGKLYFPISTSKLFFLSLFIFSLVFFFY